MLKTLCGKKAVYKIALESVCPLYKQKTGHLKIGYIANHKFKKSTMNCNVNRNYYYYIFFL